MPQEPLYEGPTEWELRRASDEFKARSWHLERRHEKFAATRKHVIEQSGGVTISHELNLSKDPREAMRSYLNSYDGTRQGSDFKPGIGKISSEFNNLYNKSTKPASTDCI